jgi:hypothetical protein
MKNCHPEAFLSAIQRFFDNKLFTQKLLSKSEKVVIKVSSIEVFTVHAKKLKKNLKTIQYYIAFT